MNYLGHLYLSGNHPDLMLSNLYGDFVKGKDYSYLPQIIQEGVDLHRQIDDFVDRHPLVTELRLQLYTDLPKVAGIAIDLYFDHLLADRWQVYHPQPLNQFVDYFFDFALDEVERKHNSPSFEFPKQFIHLIHIMEKQGWLKQYKKIEGLEMASKGLSNRISFPNNLNEASLVFRKHQNRIEHVFEEYISDAKKRFDIQF
ncbi:MAG TPA: ACP phosphodiesterase [Brumimicrobium sp.]|nr:ACP phosphodiesterase [Brumimicrobium sp.]